MPRIDAKTEGAQFVQKLQGRAVLNLNKLKAEFLALSSPESQQVALEALRNSPVGLLQDLASSLEKAL